MNSPLPVCVCRLFGASCAGCGEVIPPSEVVRTAQENIYHIHCFLCVLCRQPLHTGDHFYLRDDGQLICKADYHRTTTDAAAAPPGRTASSPLSSLS